VVSFADKTPHRRFDMDKVETYKYLDAKNILGIRSKVELKLEYVDPIMVSTYRELIEDQAELNLPYILAILKNVSSFHLHPMDGLSIKRQKSTINPVTKEQIESIFFYVIDGLKDEFAYLGASSCVEDEKLLRNYLLAVSPISNAEVQKSIATAQHIIGSCYFHGQALPKDHAKAFKFFTHAAQNGNKNAQNNLGYCLQYSLGTVQEPCQSLKWYDKAVNGAAENNRGYCYQWGIDVKQDHKKAIDLYSSAKEQGVLESIKNLAFCYILDSLDGENKLGLALDLVFLYRKEKDKAFKDIDQYEWQALSAKNKFSDLSHIVKQAADKEMPVGLCALAMCQQHGIGLPTSKEAATILFTSMVNSAKILETRHYADKQKAFKIYTLASSIGWAEAQNRLGWCLQHSVGTPMDQKKAFKYYTFAAKQNLPEAQYNLAVCKEHGFGCATDVAAALQLYKKAQEAGIHGANDAVLRLSASQQAMKGTDRRKQGQRR
jgi:TPR repeat protein